MRHISCYDRSLIRLPIKFLVGRPLFCSNCLGYQLIGLLGTRTRSYSYLQILLKKNCSIGTDRLPLLHFSLIYAKIQSFHSLGDWRGIESGAFKALVTYCWCWFRTLVYLFKILLYECCRKCNFLPAKFTVRISAYRIDIII